MLINGEGYVLLPLDLAARYFAREPVTYGYSPTFVERSNVQGDYGDNQQDFWLTVSDRDWSLGEQQKYYRSDAIAARRYYRGTAADISVAGEVAVHQGKVTVTGLSTAVVYAGTAIGAILYLGSTTNMYSTLQTGVVTSLGAHGLGSSPSAFGMCTDGYAVYLSSGASVVGVRKYESAAFTTFSTTSADSLAFVNNTLYGINNTTNILSRYSTDGSVTTLYQWKQADGDSPTGLINATRMLPYGGKVLILARGPAGLGSPGLWQYDGIGVNSVASLPGGFLPWDLARYGDQVVISGYRMRTTGTEGLSRAYVRPALYSYISGSMSLLWQADEYLGIIRDNTSGFAGGPAIAPLKDGCIFHDEYSDTLKYYDSSTGGVSTVSESTFLSSANGSVMVAAPDYLLTFDIPNTNFVTNPWLLDSGTRSQLNATTILG